MIISHKHKFIFTKPSKVAGTSIEVALGKHCGEEDILTPNSEYDARRDETEHAHPGQNYRFEYSEHLTPRDIIERAGAKIWNEYYTFTVVRNPWDQVVSRYYWNVFLSGQQPPFKKFLQNFNPLWTNTRYYFDDSGELTCDRYLRYERLEADFKIVCDRLQIPHQELPKLKSRLRKTKLHYSNYYDEEAKQIVTDHFAKEIETFGYVFEDKADLPTEATNQ